MAAKSIFIFIKTSECNIFSNIYFENLNKRKLRKKLRKKAFCSEVRDIKRF